MALFGMQIDLFSIILLLIIYYMNISKTDNRENKLFNNVIFSTIIILILDCCMFAIDGHSVILNTIATLLYYIFTPIVGYCSIIYLEYKIEHSRKRIKIIQMVTYPLLAIYSVLCFLSIKTGWIFKVDNNGIYHRGDFFWISETICLLLIAFPVIRATKILIRTNDKTARKSGIDIVAVVIPPVAGGLIQLVCYGVSTNWLGVVISIFIIFVNFQNAAITTDALTGINNRRVLYRYLEDKTTLIGSNQRLFVYLIDVNEFKKINDTFGHAEGDNALIYIAEILKSACSENDDFLARIGGDEFSIVCIRGIDEDTSDVTNMIKQKIERFNTLKCAEYSLSLSIGCAEFGKGDTLTVDTFMKKADELMYEDKKYQK